MKLLLSFFAAGLLSMSDARADYWNLPQTLNEADTAVKFTLDTTWHDVEGTVKKVSGRAWLQDPADYRSVRAEVILPVAAFDTENSSRDEEMRNVMAEPQFPEVKFTLEKAEGLCEPAALAPGQPCSFKAFGKLTIRNVTKDIMLTSTARQEGATDYLIEGDTVLAFPEYHVEDPSILVARVHPDVKVHFSMTLKQKA